jgi:hypothetical protein
VIRADYRQNLRLDSMTVLRWDIARPACAWRVFLCPEKAMPSKSPAQRKLMAAAAHNPQIAKKAGVPQSVAKEFHAADKRRAGHGSGGKRGK